MHGKIILLITLLSYSIIVSQSFMYMLALKKVQLKMEADSYTELRKLINASMTGNFTYVVYAALLFTLALVIVTIKTPGSLQFIMAAIAFIALIADTILTVKGNLPLNDMVNSWSPGNYPANWTDNRAKWFHIFQYRQVANIIGFVSLLIGAVFGSK
jgi:uncharacterized membrane protein